MEDVPGRAGAGGGEPISITRSAASSTSIRAEALY